MKTTFQLLFLGAAICLAINASAQVVEYPYSNYIAKGKYKKAESKIEKTLKSEPDATIYYAAAILYSTKDYKGFDTDKAYNNMLNSQEYYKQLDGKRLEKLEKRGYNNNMYSAAFADIAALAIEQADLINTVAGYDHFLELYTKATTAQKTDATDKRNALAYAETKQKNTVEAYNEFLRKYPNAKEKQVATSERNALAYARADGIKTISAYKQFIETYPDAKETSEAWANIYQIAYNDAQRENTEDAYRGYAAQYPQSPYAADATELANTFQFKRETSDGDLSSYIQYVENHPTNTTQCQMALQAMYRIASKSLNIEILDFVVESPIATQALRDSCLLVLHDIYTRDGSIETLCLFYEYYDISSSCDTLQNLKGKDHKIYDYLDFENRYQYPNDEILWRTVIKTAAPYPLALNFLRRLIQSDLEKKNWAKAAATVREFKSYFGNDNAYRNLLTVLEAPLDKTIKVNNFGANINTVQGNEYAQAMSADGMTLLFTGKDRKDNLGGEDIFISTKRNGVWGKAKLFPNLNTAYGSESPEALSADGTKLILFKNGKLCVSEKTKNNWTYPEELPINICDWQADAMITSDGRAILFAASEPTPYQLDKPSNVYEAANIYVSILDENGEWSEPIDLGPTINTPFCDRSPLLHPDMKTLYFCSQGHGALGGLDVFKSTRLSDDSWTEWSEPVSLGKEINTTGNECWYKISTDGKTAYFSKRVNNNEDIFWLNLPEKMRPNPVATISGKLLDTKGQPVTAEIRWEDLDSHEVIGQSQTDPEDGSYFIILPMGRNYGYYIDDDRYFPLSSNLNLTTKNENVVMENNLEIASIQQMIDDGTPMPLNNIFFNVDESVLLPTSITELKRIASLIQKNNRKIELSGHTDSTGDDEHNQKLSEERAQAAKDFLVSEGCDENNVIAVGYGKKRPVADNKTAEGRRKNRRVELKFVE